MPTARYKVWVVVEELDPDTGKIVGEDIPDDPVLETEDKASADEVASVLQARGEIIARHLLKSGG